MNTLTEPQTPTANTKRAVLVAEALNGQLGTLKLSAANNFFTAEAIQKILDEADAKLEQTPRPWEPDEYI